MQKLPRPVVVSGERVAVGERSLRPRRISRQLVGLVEQGDAQLVSAVLGVDNAAGMIR